MVEIVAIVSCTIIAVVSLRLSSRWWSFDHPTRDQDD